MRGHPSLHALHGDGGRTGCFFGGQRVAGFIGFNELVSLLA